MTRKVHHLVCLPGLAEAERFSARLARIGNIASDGRPILGLDSRDLLETLLEVSPRAVLIPAHIWTPWFSVLGSKSGFNSIEECYRDSERADLRAGDRALLRPADELERLAARPLYAGEQLGRALAGEIGTRGQCLRLRGGL